MEKNVKKNFLEKKFTKNFLEKVTKNLEKNYKIESILYNIFTMGLVWSEPRKVKEGTKIVVNASMPSDKPTKDALWDIWRMHKEKLKNDGFSVGKHPRSGLWQVSYWHTITPNSEAKAEDDRMIWQHGFDNAYAKWENIVNKIKNAAVASIANASEETFEDE